MQKPKNSGKSNRTKHGKPLGTFEALEDRCLLAPVLTIPFGGTFMLPTVTGNTVFIVLGFVSTRLVSSQTGRIEVDPTGAFGNDLFVISRGTPAVGGGLVPVPVNPGDAAGQIYRVDPYAVDGVGTMTAGKNRQQFAVIPGGGSSFGGYENWFDLAFDPTGTFTAADGGPSLFVSTLDAATTAGINPRNAIYGFLPDGSLVTPITPANPSGVFAYSVLDAFHPGIHDSQIGAIAVAPGDTFGRDLFALDVACDNLSGITCDAGDGNTMFHVSPVLPQPINLDAPPVPLNQHVENTLPPLTPLPINNDLDVRAMVFDPQRGIILQGQFGEPAFQRFGGLFVASSDFEPGDTFTSRIIQFPNPGAPPVDLIPPTPVDQLMIGDMSFDPVGYFGGGIFFTDYITGTVNQLLVDPVSGFGFVIPFASNFNVQSPTQFLPTDPPGVTPAQAYRDAFSITFSHDGEIMFVSDRDGVWGFYANTLAHTPAGTVIGLNDIRELHAPYTGQGFAAAIIDSGVDGAHLGFQGTVAPGYSPAVPGPGNFDFTGHGTSVAGIVHQIVPDAVIEPINLLFGTTNSFFLNNTLYKATRFVLDNPTVDDPRTAQLDPVPIVAVNMSIGIRGGPDENLISDLNALQEAPSVTIPLKDIFGQYRDANGGMGIVPVASAGNSGQAFGGMVGADIPGILNESVQVAATYPYNSALDIFDPDGRPLGPPVAPDPTDPSGFIRCTLEAGDLAAYTGKLTAFSNRSVTTDFAAPGTCVSTFTPSFFNGNFGPIFAFASAIVPAPLDPFFNGTSAAAPVVTGHFVFGFDVIQEWMKVIARGGVISPTDPDEGLRNLNQYLTRDLGLTTTISVGGAVPGLGAYLNTDGVNSILQWSAQPWEDVNAGESFLFENGLEDDVRQERLIGSARFRTYSEPSLANFLSSVEGTIAVNYFIAHPADLAMLDSATAFSPGLITAADIDTFVANSTKSASARAMARMLGGSDRIARINRLTFLDLVQDGRQDGGIFTSSLTTLSSKLLPLPNEFVITNRAASADKHYALDGQALRNYHDLKFRPDMVAKIGKKYRNKSPDQIRLGTGGDASFRFLPRPEIDLVSPGAARVPDYKIIGRDGNRGSLLPPTGPFDPPPVVPPIGGGGSGSGATSIDNLATLDEGGIEYVYHTNDDGSLIEYARLGDGTWQPTDLTAATGGARISSDLIAIDRDGASSRVVFGLTADGHVVRYEFAGGNWSAEDVTAAGNLPPINSSLTGLVLHRATGDTTVVYGLNSSGELIEYRNSRIGWTSRNVSQLTRSGPLQPNVLAWGEIYRNKTERIFVFATTADGHAIQYYWTGKRWSRVDLSNLPTGTTVAAESLVVLPPATTGGLPSLFGLDGEGSLWRYTGNLRIGWESIGNAIGGPALTGELGAQFAAGANKMFVFGVDRQGRMIQYGGQSGNWSWSEIGSSTPAPTGDVSASTNYRSFYSELIDGALAEFWLGDTWNIRRLSPDSASPGSGDGSMATNRLITLALASR